jgi:anti-sigma B factor antagonist
VELQIKTQTLEEATVLEVAGELEIYTAPRLQEHIEAQLAQGKKTLIVNLGQVEFIDSTGLAVLNAARVRLRDQGGKLLLICNKERVLRPFAISGLDHLFSIYPTPEAALAALAERKAHSDGPHS